MERRKPVSPNAEKPHTIGISNPKRCPHPNPTWAGESLLWSSLWFSSVPVLLCKVALCRAESSLICWFPYEKCSLRKEIWPLLHQEEPWETDGISSASGVIITNKKSLQQAVLWMTQTTAFPGLLPFHWFSRMPALDSSNSSTEDAQNVMGVALFSWAGFQN